MIGRLIDALAGALFAAFAWREVGRRGAWAYFENTATGVRRVKRWRAGIVALNNAAWLCHETDDLDDFRLPSPPPSTDGGYRRPPRAWRGNRG